MKTVEEVLAFLESEVTRLAALGTYDIAHLTILIEKIKDPTL